MAERYALFERDPNTPWDIWIAKIGTKQEIEDFIRQEVEKGDRDYLDSVIRLKEGEWFDEIERWLPEEEE